MTDDLIARLRKYQENSMIYPEGFGEAADALEKKDKQIASLSEALNDAMTDFLSEALNDAMTAFLSEALNDAMTALFKAKIDDPKFRELFGLDDD